MAFQLRLDGSLAELSTFLKSKKWIGETEKIVRLEKPGEGNMNLVARAATDWGRTLILKQASPFVQKYPTIAAPVERVFVENRFYELASERAETAAFLPKTIGFDAENHLLALEDLGAASDFLWVYQKGKSLQKEDAASAAAFLSRLHGLDFDRKTRADFPKNLALRQLNAQHLFHFPFSDATGFDLDSVQKGLASAARPFQKNGRLKRSMAALERRYLGAGRRLLHGDFYPGSWLSTEKGFRAIDPEFCFFGPPEYDFGVFLAHLEMAQSPADSFAAAQNGYARPAFFDEKLAEKFAAMEIFRRLIGLAQLPVELSVDEKKVLLARAASVFGL